MLKISLADGVNEQWLAEHLSGLLDQTKTRPDDDGPPWFYEDLGKWQLDRGNNYWLREDDDGFKVTARYLYNRERIKGFADGLRQCPQITSVTVESF